MITILDDKGLCIKPGKYKQIDQNGNIISEFEVPDKNCSLYGNREYIIVCNKHKAMFPGCLLFWGHRTKDEESRSFGGYISDIDKCERYSIEDLEKCNYNFPIYDGEDELHFRKMDNVIIKIDDLLALYWLKTMTVVYRP